MNPSYVQSEPQRKLANMPVIRPSDARAWAECVRRVWLDNAGTVELPDEEDAFVQLVIERGIEHERFVLVDLAANAEIVEAQSELHTQELMAAGIEVIYQGQLFDEKLGLVGRPDFLIRTETGEYQAADAKLAASADKKEIKVQIGVYRRLLGNGLPGIVLLGNGDRVELGDEVDAVTDQFLQEMGVLLQTENEPSMRYAHSKCQACPYLTHCLRGFEANDDLSLLYGVQGRAADGLHAVGIGSIEALSHADPAEVPDVPFLKGGKKDRAVLQAKSVRSGRVYQIAPLSLPTGTWIHFDIEDNPLTSAGDKHVYLWGFLEPSYGESDFRPIWTDSEDEDHQGWLRFLQAVAGYRAKYPDLVLAHYAHHERSTIAAYASRYDMLDDPVVEYLLSDDSPLFDIQQPILQSLVLPLRGYGLKDICKHPQLVNFQWQDAESGSQWSVVQLHRFLDETDPSQRHLLKSAILSYNKDDVLATRMLELWLREHFDGNAFADGSNGVAFERRVEL